MKLLFSLCLVSLFLFLSVSLGYKNKVVSLVLEGELNGCVTFDGRLGLSLTPPFSTITLPPPSLSFHLLLHTVQFGMSTYITVLKPLSTWVVWGPLTCHQTCPD